MKGDHLFKNFILYIIGTTAAGKTKLSLNLGQKFGGEIVSCDSMQIYEKVDIMTAKVTKQEQEQVKHHMIDVLRLDEQNFNRNEYFHKSFDCVKQIYGKNKIPIIVGGTHYYIETLMFDQKIAEAKKDQNIGSSSSISSGELEKKRQQFREKLDQMSADQLFAKLKQLDPLLANKVHQNNTKRVKQYITLLEESGGEKTLSGQMQNYEKVPLRMPNCLVFWPRCEDKSKLKEQQLKRIREMVEEGGFWEAIKIIEELIGKEVKVPGTEDFDVSKDLLPNEEKLLERGVLQSIGYKEFLPIYKYLKQKFGNEIGALVGEDEKVIKQVLKEDEKAKAILENCIERLHLNTFQMAKKQIQWIKHRIITNCDSKEMAKRLFVLDFQEYSAQNFHTNVIEPALQITEEYLKLLKNHGNNVEKALDVLGAKKEIAKYLIREEELQEIVKSHYKKGLEDWENFYCQTCEVEIHGQKNYEIHMNSNRHKKRQQHIEKIKNLDPNSQHFKAIMNKRQKKQLEKENQKKQQQQQ